MSRIIGKVILAGAGPGDPELVTLKTLNYLKKADVILTDRLVSPVLIDEYASKKALVIYVGKQCSKGIHTPQEKINELMVEFASEGKLVLRLKGGDASLFSNILDELQILKEHRIMYEIIPGISAAFGAAAYSGIPLTARNYSRGLRLLTLYDLKNIESKQWIDWASTSDTLVFYMSGQRLKTLANQLIANGINTDKSIAVIQQATTPNQQTKIIELKNIDSVDFPSFDYVPTLIIVGYVANLYETFSWIKEQDSSTSYFDNHNINTESYAS
jgi:uroporphyrin-III C-methyltransferase